MRVSIIFLFVLLSCAMTPVSNNLLYAFKYVIPVNHYSLYIELDLPSNKKIRITERWKQCSASDGMVVDLPPSWTDILSSTEFVPNSRGEFAHLKANLRAGDEITVPSLGQFPRSLGFMVNRLFVTEQMLDLWKEMYGDP